MILSIRSLDFPLLSGTVKLHTFSISYHLCCEANQGLPGNSENSKKPTTPLPILALTQKIVSLLLKYLVISFPCRIPFSE